MQKNKVVQIGNVCLGEGYPVRLQSMTNTPTLDVEATVEQVMKIIEAGADLVRVTTPTLKEAKALVEIHKVLREKGYSSPLVADVHFNPKVAEFLAQHLEKIRINPGNFADKTGKSEQTQPLYSDASYQAELKRIEARFSPLVEICKKHRTAMRIGVNHGSLSTRILSRYGDTPEGMAQSAMEFLRICHKKNYKQVLVSMKSSDVKTMIYATRLLVQRMQQEGMSAPLHLGVTEAGNELEGRVRSAAGIAPLLLNGIGDTIRVSLTEAPEKEIPVAKKLLSCFPSKLVRSSSLQQEAVAYVQQATYAVAHVGKGKQPLVVADAPYALLDSERDLLSSELEKDGGTMHYKTCTAKSLRGAAIDKNMIPVVEINELPNLFGLTMPMILRLRFDSAMDEEELVLRASGMLSYYLTNGIGNGVWIQAEGISPEFCAALSFSILQACGLRRTKAEYISCPTCGRTRFDLEKALKEVKKLTGHLSHLKIAIMGCVVNGPGEMSDADYGYIGAGEGKVCLYKGRDCVKKNVTEREAAEALLDLIKASGDWKNVKYI